MIPADLIVLMVVFAATSAVCLTWMLVNLIRLMRREPLSGDVGKRLEQTKQVLLKPAAVFMVVGALCTAYSLFRQTWVPA